MKTDTDQHKIGELLTRGVENIYPNREFLEKRLKSGERLSLYTGYDPTAPTLHIGHGITLLKLKQFQDLGHKIIMLVGDFTGMIGDPTDKLSVRKQLTRKDVLKNAEKYRDQASKILNFSGNNPVEMRYNSEWSDKLNGKDFFGLVSHFTVPRLLERDMFQERLKEGKTVYLHEFLYPVMQAYDSVIMDIDGEVGGNDQTFNMLAGRDLMKSMKGKEKFVLALKLLTDNLGTKMGKSEGNMIAFTDSPEDMFGKVMSWRDEMILLGFELCTNVAMDEIWNMREKMDGGRNPRDFKLKLAYQITKTFLGEEAADRGQAYFSSVIQSKDNPENIPEIKPSMYDIITVLVESGLVSSKSEARRAIEQGGVRINDIKVKAEAGGAVRQVKNGDVVKKGKRFFVRVV